MAELLAKTDSAVAVDENLTVLIDWLNIEQVADFTVVVENAGGGSANDIADVQIDTSDDGGATADLDQHAGVPAVPIAAGTAKIGTFTETAAYVRIRANCAAGEDTTAKAILFADTAVARICTLADVKARLGISTTEHDGALGRIIVGVEQIFDSYCRRHLIVTSADVTEFYNGRGSAFLQLDRYPVVSITQVKIARDYNFAGVDALVADSDYRLVGGGRSGVLARIYTVWPSWPDAVQVVYRGGYCAAGQAPATGEYALPDDLREAAIEQAGFIFKRRDDLGLSSVSFQGGAIGKPEAMDLLPMVKRVLNAYVKPVST